MFDCLPVMRQLHELLSYMNEMLLRPETASLHDAIRSVYQETERLTDLEPSAILRLDIPSQRAVVNELLLQGVNWYVRMRHPAAMNKGSPNATN